MEKTNRYYWLKLKEDFFDDDTIRFLREQPNGNEYCVFYLILCCKSLKADGKLARMVGDTIIPYDLKALANLTGVSEDTAKCALALLLQYGIIRQLDTGELFLQQVLEMTGSESATRAAIKKRNYRLKKQLEDKSGDNVGTNCPTEFRVKSLDSRKKENNKKKKGFQKPTLEEVSDYCKERNNSIDPEQFLDFYESKGWLVGKTPMKDWKAAIRNWERHSIKTTGVIKTETLYQPKENDDITYQRIFELWKTYLGTELKQTNENVLACKALLNDIGEESLEKMIVALRMRSEHGFLTKDLTGIRDFVGLKENLLVVQGFYDKHWREWKRWSDNAKLGKKRWEI